MNVTKISLVTGATMFLETLESLASLSLYCFKSIQSTVFEKASTKLEAPKPDIELVFLAWWMSAFYSEPQRHLRCDPKWKKRSIHRHTDQLNMVYSISGHFTFRV